MSTSGEQYPGQPTAGYPDTRALSEDEWRASLPSFGQQLGTGLGQSSSTSLGGPAPAASVAPFSTVNTWQVRPTRSNTAAVWWMIFTPIIGGLLLWPAAVAVFGQTAVFEYLNGYRQDAGTFAFLGFVYVLAFAFGVTSFVMGFRDRIGLRRLGIVQTASPWWQLLSPLVYLILRTVYVRRETAQGQAPLVVYLCLQFAPVVLGIIAAVALPALLYAIQ